MSLHSRAHRVSAVNNLVQQVELLNYIFLCNVGFSHINKFVVMRRATLKSIIRSLIT